MQNDFAASTWTSAGGRLRRYANTKSITDVNDLRAEAAASPHLPTKGVGLFFSENMRLAARLRSVIRAELSAPECV